MKTTNYYKFLIGLALLIGTMTACVENSEFNTPIISCEEITQTMVPTSTIAQVKATYTYPPKTIQNDLIIEGYVVSSDLSGNFYNSISIQDKPENPTAGIKILINEADSHIKYNVGRKIIVNLKGLAINKSYDVFEIGFSKNEDVTNIPLPNIKNHIFRTCETAVIVPKIITLPQLNISHFDMLVQLDNMQFRREDVANNLTYAQGQLSVNRKVVSFDNNCVKLGEIILRNSGYADFANAPLPSGKGSLIVVPGKFSTDLQLYIRDLNDVKFDKPFCPSN
jgi:hypothetical protein